MEKKNGSTPHNCTRCGKDMNPVEWIMGSVCGKCVRELHRQATGRGAPPKMKREAVESIVDNLLEMAAIRRPGSNQTLLTLASGDEIFFSYETPVAAFIARSRGEDPGGFYRTEKKWSVTTSKHIGQYLKGASARVKPQEWFDSLANEA